jgi:hypothetical protein
MKAGYQPPASSSFAIIFRKVSHNAIELGVVPGNWQATL